MALIVKCRACKRRLEPGLTGSCPFCAAMSRTYVVDYMEDGRHSRRRRVILPEAIQDERAARSIEADLRASLKRRKSASPAPVSPSSTVDDLREDFLEWYGMHRAKSTAREVGYVFRGPVSRILGRVRVSEFDPRHVTLYKKLRLAEKVSNRTVNLELDYVSGFLKWCRRARGIEVTPPPMEKLPWRRPVPIVLSPGEVMRLIEAADPFHRAFLLCLYSLGLRFSEARFLRWEDLDLENRSVRVTQKGGGHKTLPLNERLAESIEAIRPERPNCPWVFESRAVPGQPVNNIRKALERIRKAAKVEKKVHPHLFRHSMATHMLGHDVNLRTIQSYLGHSQVSTTQWYTHVVLDTMRRAADATLADLEGKPAPEPASQPKKPQRRARVNIRYGKYLN